MDERIEQIIKGLQRLLKGIEGSFIAKVIEDNGDLVDVEDMNGTEYREVRKIATQGVSGLLFTLKKESYVVVSRLSNSDELFVAMMSEIEGLKVVSGKTTIEADNNENISFNGGKNNGLVLVEKLTRKINSVEKQLNDILVSLKAITITLAPTGTVPFAPYFTMLPLAETQQSEIENTKIKH